MGDAIRASLFDDAMASRARARRRARGARARGAARGARDARRALEDAREDREQWDALEAKLERLREDGDGGGFDALVDVGGEIRARARARDARAVFVDVGSGVHGGDDGGGGAGEGAGREAGRGGARGRRVARAARRRDVARGDRAARRGTVGVRVRGARGVTRRESENA